MEGVGDNTDQGVPRRGRYHGMYAPRQHRAICRCLHEGMLCIPPPPYFHATQLPSFKSRPRRCVHMTWRRLISWGPLGFVCVALKAALHVDGACERCVEPTGRILSLPSGTNVCVGGEGVIACATASAAAAGHRDRVPAQDVALRCHADRAHAVAANAENRKPGLSSLPATCKYPLKATCKYPRWKRTLKGRCYAAVVTCNRFEGWARSLCRGLA